MRGSDPLELAVRARSKLKALSRTFLFHPSLFSLILLPFFSLGTLTLTPDPCIAVQQTDHHTRRFG
jgi:hypothetical protein